MTPRVSLFLVALLLTALGTPPGAAAQQPTRETQVPIDPERGVLEVGPELRSELGLYPGVAGFEVARLFQQEDGSLVIEVSRREDGRLVREREGVDQSRLAAFRADLGARLAERGQSRALDRSGRSGLVLAQTLLGVGLHGWLVPVGFDIDSDRGAVAAYLLTAGLGFYAPYALTRRASVSVAERNSAIWGGTRGALHGLMLGELLEDPDDADGFDDEGANVNALSVLGMSVAGSILGYHAVDAADASEGEVAFWGAIGDLGIPLGFAAAYVSGLGEDEECAGDVCSIEDFGDPAGWALTLGVSLAAPLAAHWSGAGADYTIGDARALRSFGLLGAQAVLPIAWAAFDATDADDPGKEMVASLAAGEIAGVWLGNRVLRRHSLSGGAGALVLAGHLAGGLGALGITYLLDEDSPGDDNDLLYATTSSIGSLAGALLTFRAVRDRAPRTASVSAPGLRVELDPSGLMLPMVARGRGADARPLRAPLLTLRF